jgi:hypothetical protein
MAGNKVARDYIGGIEGNSGDELSNIGQLLHQLGDSRAMHALRTFFDEGILSRESIDSILTAYNNSCV